MKFDRMAALEAPRISAPVREMREIELYPRGGGFLHRNPKVRIPRAAPLPDIITYRGRSFIRRTDSEYVEASMWPIIKELDGR